MSMQSTEDMTKLCPHIHQLPRQVTGSSLMFHEAERPETQLMLQYNRQL